MADPRIAEIAARVAAVRGCRDWRVVTVDGDRVGGSWPRVVARAGEAVAEPRTHEEADLIAKAGRDLTFLLARVEARDAEIAALRSRLLDRPVERTHHAGCWRDHPECAVARLEAVAAVRTAIVAEGARATAMEAAAIADGEQGEAELHAMRAGTYEHAADLLGRALEG